MGSERGSRDTAQFICPCIASMSLKYNQQDATLSRSIYFYKLLYMFQAVPPPIIRSTTVNTASGIVKPMLLPAPIVDEMERSSISSSAHHQEHKTVNTASGIVKPLLLPAPILDEMELRSISSKIGEGSSIGLTIPDAVFTVLCS